MLFITLTLLAKKPETFNYSVKITEQNAQKQYTIATKMMRFLKLAIVLIFILIEYKTIETSKGNEDGLGKWFFPFVMVLIFVPILITVYKSFRVKNN